MNGLAWMRAIDWRTSSSRSENASAAHARLDPDVVLDRALELVVGEGEHPAVGVVDEDDLLGPEQALGDRQRADLVVGDHAAGVADDVGVALLQAEQGVGIQARVHAGEHGDLPGRRDRQIALVEARGVGLGVAQQLIGGAHGVVLLGSGGGGQRAQLLILGQRMALERAAGLDQVGAHPPQRWRVRVDASSRASYPHGSRDGCPPARTRTRRRARSAAATAGRPGAGAPPRRPPARRRPPPTRGRGRGSRCRDPASSR